MMITAFQLISHSTPDRQDKQGGVLVNIGSRPQLGLVKCKLLKFVTLQGSFALLQCFLTFPINPPNLNATLGRDNLSVINAHVW